MVFFENIQFQWNDTYFLVLRPIFNWFVKDHNCLKTLFYGYFIGANKIYGLYNLIYFEAWSKHICQNVYENNDRRPIVFMSNR